MRKLNSSRMTVLVFLLPVFLPFFSFTWSPTQNKLQASIDRGKIVYTSRCLTCHQVDGSGVPNMNPPLIKTKWVLGDKAALIEIVLKGMNTGVEIDGMRYHNVMASHADLTD